MNPIIEEIYSTRKVVGQSGRIHTLDSAVDPEEGRFIHELVSRNPQIRTALEVGCAYGMSSLHICDALRDRPGAAHTIVDPFQNTHWDGVGVANLKRAGIGFFTLIEEKSEFALPRLCQAGEERLDLVFVDGFHTFDHTLLDCFYATRLLRTGGFLVVDDVEWRSVSRCVRYFANYPCYERYGQLTRPKRRTLKRTLASAVGTLLRARPFEKVFRADFLDRLRGDRRASMIALRKVSRDERNWKWYADF